MSCDDSSVRPADPKQVVVRPLASSFRGYAYIAPSQNQKAYVLFYKRVKA